MEIIQGLRSDSLLYILEGHVYRHKVARSPHLYFYCHKENCPGTANGLPNEILPKIEHNHEPEEDFIQQLRFMKELRLAAQTERNEQFRHLYNRIGRR